MWGNYLIVALRVLARDRAYAVINVVGLALGLAACLTLLLYVQYESSYDRWLPGHDKVYQLQTFYADPQTGERTATQMSQYVVAAGLRADVPQIADGVYALTSAPVALRGGEALGVERALMVDGDLLDVLRLPLASGDARTALRDMGSAVLSESEARRLLGTTDAVGKTVTLIEHGTHVDHRVTAVFRDLPRNSSLGFSMAVRFDPAVYFADQPGWLTSFGDLNGWFFARLRPGADTATVDRAIAAWQRRHVPSASAPGAGFDWRMARIGDVHLGFAQSAAMTPGNDRGTLLTYTIAAALILGVACFNFVGLATARALRRSREVALRKLLGARRSQLILQFLGESMLVAIVAMLIALAGLELAMPSLSALLGVDLRVDYLGNAEFVAAIAGLVLLVGALGGFYPGVCVSALPPARVLRSGPAPVRGRAASAAEMLLVVAQFAVSIGLIVCTLVIYGQALYGASADPGYRRDHLLQIGIEGVPATERAVRTEALARALERIAGVTGVARTSIGVATPNHSNTSVRMPGQAAVSLGNYRVDDGFFRTMGIPLVAGRGFDAARPADRSGASPDDPAAQRLLIARGANVVVNELAARRMGFARPADAIGAHGTARLVDAGEVPITVIGVAADTRFRSIREPADPIVYRYADDFLSHLVVRYEADPAAVLAQIRQAWRRIAPDVPLEIEHSEDIVANLYREERTRAVVFASFALLAVTISCLGLFGLTALVTERRTKEIGIRKVLGAKVRDIVRLLVWQFSRPVVIANLIAWPVAWWAMRDWLNTFEVRIALTPTPFALAGLLGLAIAMATVSGHAIRAARKNPIHALRYE